jgi:hypothetical protein
MTYTRQTQLLNLTIQINSELQPVGGLAVMMVSCDAIIGADGARVGNLQHAQKVAIRSDMTPEVVQTLNDSLAYLGYKLAEIE